MDNKYDHDLCLSSLIYVTCNCLIFDLLKLLDSQHHLTTREIVQVSTYIFTNIAKLTYSTEREEEMASHVSYTR